MPDKTMTQEASTRQSIVDPDALSFEETRKARVRTKNRRRVYLDSHPSYFESPDLELADPLLYDRCVRRFQSAAEREADGRAKGYSGVLEADLYRSEAKLAALPGRRLAVEREGAETPACGISHSDLVYVAGPDGQVLPEDEDEIPQTKEEGLSRWQEAMALRFVQGDDPDFHYEEVDGNEDWDVLERQEAEEQWFEDEEPEWIENDPKAKNNHGETGIQDF